MTALTDNALCVCLPDNCQLDCSPISTPPHVPRAPRTRIHVARTRLLTTSTTPSRNAAATQRWPPRPATCQTYTLTCPTPRSHDNNYDYYQAATPPPARPPPVPQQRGRHQHETPRNPSKTPANENRVLKHHNARPASTRTSAETARHTPPTHAGASSPCPSSSPRAPTRRPPTQAAKAAISNINHHDKRRNNATTRTSSRQRSTTQRSSLVGVVVLLGGVSRES